MHCLHFFIGHVHALHIRLWRTHRSVIHAVVDRILVIHRLMVHRHPGHVAVIHPGVVLMTGTDGIDSPGTIANNQQPHNTAQRPPLQKTGEKIGGQTCGKPYGFYPTDNCGTTYFTIQFSGVNAKGFGEFSDGFVPTPAPRFAADVKGCPVGDDFSRALGDSEEGMLKTALYYSQQNSCPVLALSALTESAATEQASHSDGLAIAPPASSSPDQMIRQPIGL